MYIPLISDKAYMDKNNDCAKELTTYLNEVKNAEAILENLRWKDKIIPDDLKPAVDWICHDINNQFTFNINPKLASSKLTIKDIIHSDIYHGKFSLLVGMLFMMFEILKLRKIYKYGG